MRYLRATATGSLAVLMLAAATCATRAQVAPLAVEKDPPIATRPVAPAPVLVPQPSGPPIPAQPPAVVAPIPVPPGPGPVTVPEPPKPGPVFVPATPPIQPGSTPHEAAKPAPAPQTDAPPPPPPAVAPAPSPALAPETPPVPPVEVAPAPPPAPGGEAPPAPIPPPPAAAIEEVTVEARPVLFVTGVTTWEKSEAELNRAFASLAKAAAKLGIGEPAGPLVEYIESDSDDVGYRVMLPVATPPKGKLPKGVKLGTSPAGKALKFRHDGPIDDLEEVYARIDDEVTKRGLDARGIVEEYDADALASAEDRVVVDVWVFLK